MVVFVLLLLFLLFVTYGHDFLIYTLLYFLLVEDLVSTYVSGPGYPEGSKVSYPEGGSRFSHLGDGPRFTHVGRVFRVSFLVIPCLLIGVQSLGLS